MHHIKTATVFGLGIAFAIFTASCSEQTGNQPDITSGGYTTGEETLDLNPEPILPDVKFDGYEFTILGRPAEDVPYKEPYFYSETEDAEPINDAVFRRNLAAEEKFDIKISHMEADPVGATASKLISANDAAFDVLWEQRQGIGTLAVNRCLYNIKDFPYIDFSREYWDTNSVNQLEIADKLYFVTCDISLLNLSGARFLYFNKDIITDYNLESPYDLVHNNEWTLDNFTTMVMSVSRDLDGDGELTNKD